MRSEELAERKLQQPFQPFRLYVAGGTTYEIRQPQLLWVLRDHVLVFFPDKRRPLPAMERHESIPLEDITRLELIELPVEPGTT